MTSYGPGFKYTPYWSPDSKKICFIDQAGEIKVFDLSTQTTKKVDKLLIFSHGNTAGFSCEWSSDSRWIAYSRDLPNSHRAVFLYNVESGKSTKITDGFYSCSNPSFDPSGRYLFVVTQQAFRPYYSDFDNTFVYANSSQIGVITLSKDSTSFLALKDDVVTIKEDEPKPAETKGAEGKSGDAAAKTCKKNSRY